ncbi:hypothetical protein HA402_015775 [Bradysia odoriphaga]|nr:hypothetical protein HA402_015775 [Bradysia odoriphaga]
MAGIFGFTREAVRVKVKKCEGTLPPEWRKFSVDPQITSLEVLYSILAKAFDLKTDFAISYKTIDPSGQEVYLAVLSDWDLDAAFLRAHNLSISTSTEPCLNLKVDIKPFSESTIDWDASSNSSSQREISPLQQSIGVGQKYVQNMQTRLPGLIMNQMEKTLSMVSRALNFAEDQNFLQPPRPPLSDTEFRSFLDSVGQIVQPHELRKVIYSGGIDPSLRRVVWKHILNVYPDGMTGRERMDYMKKKAAEYTRLRDTWRTTVQKGNVVGELAYVTSMVRKDVLRTDRLHPFYAGSDDNQNIAALFNILTTYALNHPAVSYCQGMSDIASPLLVTMGDECQAYICFCAVMTRLNANFMLDGVHMTIKFSHLSEALQHYDPEFYDYLKMQQADDLLFCYRWLLLEMKREFAFDDSLHMLEVLWSSLPIEPPVKELALFEKEFTPPPNDLPPPKSPSVIMRTPRENAYTKICELRRQSSAVSLISSPPNTSNVSLSKSLDATKRFNLSLDETGSKLPPKIVTKSFQSLDESKMLSLINQNEITPFSAANQEDIENNLLANLSMEMQRNEENVLRSQPTSPKEQRTSTEASDAIELSSRPVGDSRHAANNNKHKHISQINPISKQVNHHRKGHFKELKDRIAAGKKGILSTLEKLDQSDCADDRKSTKSQKVVKNFNEFLNFATINKNRLSDKLNTNKPTLHAQHTNELATPQSKLTETTIENHNPNSIEHETDKASLQLQTNNRLGHAITLDGSSPDDSQEYFPPMTTSVIRELRLELESLDRHVFGNDFTLRKQIHLTDCDTPESGDSLIGVSKSPGNYQEISYTKLLQSSTDVCDEDRTTNEISRCPSDKSLNRDVVSRVKNHREDSSSKRISSCSANADIFVWENPLHQCSSFTNVAEKYGVEKQTENCEQDICSTTPDEQIDIEFDGEIETTVSGKKSVTPIRLLRKNGRGTSTELKNNGSSKRNSIIYTNDTESENSGSWNDQPDNDMKTSNLLKEPQLDQSAQLTTSVEEASEANIIALTKVAGSLPPPNEFGGGNPFLMFLCLTLLLQHRNYVMKSNMDYNEMAMHFDKMVRKHNVTRVLNQARRMYADYLKSQRIVNAVGGIQGIETSSSKSELRT